MNRKYIIGKLAENNIENSMLYSQELTTIKPLSNSQGPADPQGPVMPHPATVPMPLTLEEAANIFSDPLHPNEYIHYPFIAPDGTTHNFSSITKYIDADPTCPIKKNQLKLNLLYMRLMKIFFTEERGGLKLKKELDLVELKKALSCPLSGVLLTDPVVAANNNTYERKFLKGHLDCNDHFTPGIPTEANKVKQSVSLEHYTNQVVLNLYQQQNFKALMEKYFTEQIQPNKETIRNVEDYALNRANQPIYTGLPLGYNVKEKYAASMFVLRQLHGDKNENNPNERALRKAATQGNLGKIISPSLVPK